MDEYSKEYIKENNGIIKETKNKMTDEWYWADEDNYSIMPDDIKMYGIIPEQYRGSNCYLLSYDIFKYTSYWSGIDKDTHLPFCGQFIITN